MGHQEIDHWSYEIYQDHSGNLYIHDREEGLTFVRGKVGQNKYDLAVIIEEENDEYWKWTDILSPDQPCGFQLFDEIELGKWNCLAKEYIRNKLRGEQTFREWIREQFYYPLGKELYEQSWIGESMPYPGAPAKEWEDFDRVYKEFRKKRSVSPLNY